MTVFSFLETEDNKFSLLSSVIDLEELFHWENINLATPI